MAGERQFIVLPAQALMDPRLDAPAKLVLMALATRANKDGICWPGVERLAADSSLSARAVKRALQLLVKVGRIERIRRQRPLTAITRIVYDRPLSELIAEYGGAGAGSEEDGTAKAYDLDDPAPLDENEKGHTGPSEIGGDAREATQAPPDGPHRPVELCAVELNYSSSPRGVSTGDDIAHADAEDAVSEAPGQIPESRGVGEATPPAEDTAALRAPTSGPPQPTVDDPDLRIGLSARFTEPDHRTAYLSYRRGHRFPTAYDAELRTLHEPMTGGRPVPWEVIGRQLLQLQANGEAFNARLFAGYCRSAMAASTAEPVTPRPSRLGADRSTATRSKFLELVGKQSERAS